MGNIEITTKLSRLKSVSSTDDDYLEAATGGVLKNFVIFTGKHLCWRLFLIKLQACKFIEKRTPTLVFSFACYESFQNERLLPTLFVFGCLFTIINLGEENVH